MYSGMLVLIIFVLSAAKEAITNYPAPGERRHVLYLSRHCPGRRTFAQKWNYGLTRAARGESHGGFTTWTPDAHSIHRYAPVVVMADILLLNVRQHPSVITAARTTWELIAQQDLDMPMRLWRTDELTFSVTVTGSLWIM